MNLDKVFSAFDILLRNMGATKVTWRHGASRERIDVDKILKTIGIDVAIDEVVFDRSGLATYAGLCIILYIKSTKNDRETLLCHPENAVRFHVADCSKLDQMRAENRFERYVATRDTSGSFLVNAWDWKMRTSEEVRARLRVCKLCLEHLDYKGYKDKKKRYKIWSEFSIEEFLSSYTPEFREKPRYTDETAPPPGYTEDWESVSRTRRDSVGWRCEACGVDLSAHKDLLHTHHRNGVTADNSPDNLQVLCAICHSKQPGHRMHVSGDTYIRIEALRHR